MMRVAAVAAAVLVLAGCLPIVAEETVESLEGPHVVVVTSERMRNPSDEWNYEYVMLEVTGPGSRLERISSVLRDNGWSIEDGNARLLAYFTRPGEEKPETELILVRLDDFLDPHSSDKVTERFAEVPTHDGATYYVAVLTPLTRT